MILGRAAFAVVLYAEWNFFLTFHWAHDSESKCPYKSYSCQTTSNINYGDAGVLLDLWQIKDIIERALKIMEEMVLHKPEWF